MEKTMLVTQLPLVALEVEAVMMVQQHQAALLLLILVVQDLDSLVEKVTTPQVVAVEELEALVERED